MIAERLVPGTGDVNSMEVQTWVENLVAELTRLMESDIAGPSFYNNAAMLNFIQRLNDSTNGGGFFNRSGLPPVSESANPNNS